MTSSVDQYLASRSRSFRLTLLQTASIESLRFPLDLVEQLLSIDISMQEKIEVLNRASAEHKVHLEDFITRNIAIWPQPLATMALRKWTLETDCLLWHRFIPLLKLEGTPQRIRYTILEISPKFSGEEISRISCETPGLEDFSPAFHALLLERCLAYNIDHVKVKALANTVLRRNISEPFPQDKAFLSAITYLSIYDPDSLRDCVANQSFSTIWNETAQAWLIDGHDFAESVRKLLHVAFAAGSDTVDHPEIEKERISYQLNQASIIPTNQLDLGKIEKEVYRKEYKIDATNLWRQAYFSFVQKKKKPDVSRAPVETTFWSLMFQTLSDKKSSDLNKLSEFARQSAGVFTVCYIQLLGQMAGEDLAVLKILDFIRSQDEDEIQTVLGALAAIGTQRSLQELISFLSRPNVKMPIRLQVAQLLQGKDLSKLQPELKSASKDFMKNSYNDPIAREIVELLSELITVKDEVEPQAAGFSSIQTSDEDLDRGLLAIIPQLSQLSAEVKRALRTAIFFDMSTRNSSHAEHIDLSPLIDMQYKALELFFRENFEDDCNNVLNKGILQRKLDIIGYARPIPQAMDQFENYLANLPIISEIPFFSKFKLRKMLRGICQFHPGKRFTLDGLKAFGLFFLCFSRKSCNYGLQNMFQINIAGDQELFEFCKELHVFQDFRNRAAHEGFHPEARADAQKIWGSTAKIIDVSLKAKLPLPATMAAPAQKREVREVIVEHKRRVS